MPFPSLRSRPGTSASQKRPRSTYEPSTSKKDAPSPHKRTESLKRLSLHLTKSNGNETFQPLFTHEPDGVEDRPKSAASNKQLSQEKDISSPPVQMPPEQSTTTPQAPPTTDGTIAEPVTRPQRFSLLRFKNASDPQLSTRFKAPPPNTTERVPPAPAIITTAPTSHNLDEPEKKRSINKLLARAPSPFRRSTILRNQSYNTDSNGHGIHIRSDKGAASTPNLPRPSTGMDQIPPLPTRGAAPPAYGDDSSSQLAIPVDRLSDSSRSDGSDHRVYAQTTTTHTISTTTTFFKLRRRKKDKGPLFPLPERLPRPSYDRTSISKNTPNGRKSMSPSRKSTNVRFDPAASGQCSPAISPTHSTLALTNAPHGTPGPSILRKESTHSGHSTPPITLIPPRLGARGRSSTLSSLGRSAEKLIESVPQPPSTRTSTSTTGRRSFGDLLTLPHRFRQNSAPPARHVFGSAPGTPGSKSNSLQIPRESEPELVYPKRDESDTPASYLEKLECAVPRGSMATILCKGPDDFSKTCLRKYMRGFSYFGESIDMAVRKMLMEVELPKETQQIDRLLGGFADRYHECNPGIFVSTDETTFVAFSILLLHSDTHNKNNKRKMTKHDYFKNTQQGPVQVSTDVLDCLYDNICYTPFIHFDDEIAINSHRLSAPKQKKSLLRSKSSEKLRGPVDPYLLILDNKLDVLRPSLKDVMDTEDTYKSVGASTPSEINNLHKAFLKSSVLQIVSARSRPDAFMTQATIHNPAEASAGLVSIKVAKVGLLWRKDPKKKKASRPWQEWGAILTDSKLYFFKDDSWVKKLCGQYEAHSKGAGRAGPLIFKPPVSSFDPDALMAMDDAVALVDSSYKKHKNAFTFIKHGGFEEVFLANSETEMVDWIGKLNYAATFRTAGVRMRGLLGTTYEGRQMIRKNSELSTLSAESQIKETPNLTPNRKVDMQANWEISFYRRQLIHEKLSDLDEKIASTQKELDHLMRNARHLLVLLPVQAKTREALVLAAGRMSAKLTWTRVELWRAKTHHDILMKDLEQEYPSDFPAPKTTPQKATPIRTSQQSLSRQTTDASRQTLSPVGPAPATSRRPSQPTIDTLTEPAKGEKRPKSPLLTHSPLLSPHELGPKDDQGPVSSLTHQPSLTNSYKGRLDPEKTLSPSEESEERVLREAGLIGVDGVVPKDKRPDTSGSERDRVGAVSPTSDYRGSSMRRTLQRSLRDSHGSHHAPTFHKHKKGRESGSSLLSDEGSTSIMSGESNELKRGTGSFILHGKKASVITMSSEWQSMSNDDRMGLRKDHRPVSEHGNDKKVESAVDDDSAGRRGPVRKSSMVESFNRMRKMSIASMSVKSDAAATEPEGEKQVEDEDFVDAKSSVEGTANRRSVYKDAKEEGGNDSPTLGKQDDESGSEDDEETSEQANGKVEDANGRVEEVNDESDDDSESDSNNGTEDQPSAQAKGKAKA